MTTTGSSHTVIIHDDCQNGQQQNIRNTAENVPKTAHLTEMNVVTLPICVRCEATATRHYYTTAFKMGGISYPSELRMLCQDCYDLVWSVMLKSLEARVKTQERLLEEDDSEYEPYYSRADEMADQANADYYDEIARGGQVA